MRRFITSWTILPLIRLRAVYHWYVTDVRTRYPPGCPNSRVAPDLCGRAGSCDERAGDHEAQDAEVHGPSPGRMVTFWAPFGRRGGPSSLGVN
jgi:hypothetical protein